jgi:hypothetical protein
MHGELAVFVPTSRDFSLNHWYFPAITIEWKMVYSPNRILGMITKVIWLEFLAGMTNHINFITGFLVVCKSLYMDIV